MSLSRRSLFGIDRPFPDGEAQMPDILDTSMTTAKPDGRHDRKAHSRALILAACRVRMIGGTFRPPMPLCCELASRSIRCGFQLFTNVEGLYLEALQDPATREAILSRMLGDEVMALTDDGASRLLRAVVLGKVGA